MSVVRMVRRLAPIFSLLVLSLAAHGATLPTGFAETRVATGLASPTAMSFAPDGRLFVAQQSGALRVIKNGALLSQPFLTVSVNSSGERGLLGVAFDPNFASNNFVYVYYTTSTSPIHNRLSRFTASAANPDVVAAGSEVQLLNLPNLSSATNHNGGAIHFGTDGRLYIAVGENANSANAQSFTTTLGKVLRINADGSIPSDNPFLGQTTGMNQAIWAMGLRNPFNFAIDRTNGRIHVNDVGQDTWEEVNLGVAGANYGWPQIEGPNPAGVAGSDAIRSIPTRTPASFCAITGAAFYRPVTATFPGRIRRPLFLRRFLRRLHPHAEPAELHDLDELRLGHQLAGRHPGSYRRLAVLPGARRRRSVPRAVHGQHRAHHFDAAVEPHGRRRAICQLYSGRFGHGAAAVPVAAQRRQHCECQCVDVHVHHVGLPTMARPSALIVSNAAGSATSNSATLTVLSNIAPTGTITAPANGTNYRGGQTFTFSGTGTDPEDGSLPPSAFTWRVDFHHDDHTHPHLAPVSGVTSGTFTIANRGETSANVFYRVILTVRDSSGLTHTSSVDVRPLTSVVRIESNVPSAQLTLDGAPITAPFTFTGVEGIIRTLGVVTPQTSGGTTYDFVSWSDGGQATHEIVTPNNDTTFTRAVPAGGHHHAVQR